jgi:hypothetical protein
MAQTQSIYWYNTGTYEAEWSDLADWSEKQGTAEATKDYLPKGYLFARAVWLYNMLYRNGGSNIESDEWHKVFRGISLKEARYNSPITLSNSSTKAIEERLEFLLLKAHKEYKREVAMQEFVESRWSIDFMEKYDEARSQGIWREEADRAGTKFAMEMRTEYRNTFK